MNKETLIENYFSNRLSEEGFQQLEQLLETDAVFRQEFYSQLEIRQAIAHEKHKPIKERLQKLDQKPVKKKPWYLYAAAITILIAISFLFYDPQPDYQQLYATHFEPYPNIVAPTVRDINSSDSQIGKAFNYYDNQNYKEAIKAFDELYKKDKTGYANFYYAMSLMADNQSEKAINALENTDWKIPEKYQVQTDWYLALCYLKLENKEKAIGHLEKVTNSNKLLRRKAKEILKVLRSKE